MVVCVRGVFGMRQKLKFHLIKTVKMFSEEKSFLPVMYFIHWGFLVQLSTSFVIVWGGGVSKKTIVKIQSDSSCTN